MRNAINTTANVTINAIVNRSVATAMVGVDAPRASQVDLRLYHAAPAPHRWALSAARKHAGKQKPECAFGKRQGMPGSDLSRSHRAEPRCRRPRLSSCLGRS